MLKFFNRLFNVFRPAPRGYPANNTSEPAYVTHSKVLVINYDPMMDSGVKLSKHLNWHNIADLIEGFVSDILEASNGLARYEVVERIDVNEFPAKTDGFRYTPQTYLDVLNRVATPHIPQEVNYNAILNQFNILQRIANNEIDEVWIFAFPHAGFYESTMGGPDAFWCNAQPLANASASKRRFVIMGFSYERFIGEMHESFGHRAESIMEKTFSKVSTDKNLWNRFTRYDKIAPGKAACGNIHFAPNSQSDYDWGNKTPVKSECFDWLLNFPNFKNDIRIVDSSLWGGGEIRAHHKWWFNHFPRVAGRQNGIANNWWQYVVNPQKVIV
ncbi:MAG: hypothetical protein KF758_03745 [Anaerolineales bacterium]|nr:hypothetical protein [Anaerolineales bacterium]MBX3036005.1 hypothetical protein [Anaerolineales bacterium]